MYRLSGGIFRFRHAFQYSTISPVHPSSGDRSSTNLMVDYLIHSLRFTKQDAVSLSAKGNLTHLKSTINSDLVLDLLKNYGLNLTQIKEIVSSVPKILTCKANKTLEPKIRVFQELGLSGSDLVSLVKRNPEMFGFGLHTRIMPGLNLLRKILGSDENVIKAINRSRWLCFTNYSMKRLSTNISALQNFGLMNERIVKFMISNPEKLMVSPKLLESKMSYVEEKLGISRDLPSFIHAVSVTLYCTDSDIEKKMQIFKSFGWSDSEIAMLFRNQPYCLNKSDGNLVEKLEYYMNEIGYTPLYLISCNSFFTFSLKKRVIPRNKMLSILKEKALVNEKPNLITIVSWSEQKFLNFLRGFEDDIPGLCETYIGMFDIKKVP
ncbi:transcription termination factor MTEF18, mitochondrial-like [Rutidosis leptorrhynchoides]|uniref:transcription termination factor MTEF18, mitochondrial-like n=1 Tax=Rutidosis leptorrhynchoides TaxID=125765 RepID=UPI003A9940F4